MIVGVNASWTPNCWNSTVIIAVFPTDPGWATGYWKLAACKKARGLTGDRGQVGLGQYGQEAFGRERRRSSP